MFSASRDPNWATGHWAPEAVLRNRLKICNGCPHFTTVNGGGCLKASGDCVDCVKHREAMLDAIAYKDAECPDGRWPRKKKNAKT